MRRPLFKLNGTRALVVAAALTATGGAALFAKAESAGGLLFDRYGRLAAFPGKEETACPSQDARTAVILAAGQSNIANHAAAPAKTSFPDKVFGFYDERCAPAASPLLGATNIGGEWLTLLGDALIRSGRYDKVVIAPASVGGQPIFRFAEGDLGVMLDETATKLAGRYRVTHVIWHQGESDYAGETGPDAYRAMFLKIVARLRAKGMAAPVFVSVATYCPPMREWKNGNAIQTAQRALADERLGVWPGVDSDAFDPGSNRSDDCHFSAAGQAKMAEAQAKLILDRAPR
ncbi:sialate O-acetylesterase [Methylocystis parvus]|uniref:SGNH/GDSL hydrolase family protein n=1 Tax=Methylocystis parvus TaxID=134 RepID=A0A6B8M5P9_9HYPH|nr:sialate O-acetylesterase [Methylocystis parvus]QGM97059.1 SGNH/GDSL hydrolase family protein [Methylocystis parvus]WBJ99041.1 SGNH/GDSL hydrolase family protein [Methylocystis parvus OBBP]